MSTPSVSPEQIERIAELARMTLSEREREKFGEEISEVLGYVRALEEKNVDGVKPFSHAADLENVMRKDVREPSSKGLLERIHSQFPRAKGALLKIQAVLEQRK